MTELEALQELVAIASHTWGQMTSATKDKGKVAHVQKAIDIVSALIARVEEAEVDPMKRLKMAEEMLESEGLVVVDYVEACQVRDVLIDHQMEEFADALTNQEIALQLSYLVSKWEPATGLSDWTGNLEYTAARHLAEANGKFFES